MTIQFSPCCCNEACGQCTSEIPYHHPSYPTGVFPAWAILYTNSGLLPSPKYEYFDTYLLPEYGPGHPNLWWGHKNPNILDYLSTFEVSAGNSFGYRTDIQITCKDNELKISTSGNLIGPDYIKTLPS